MIRLSRRQVLAGSAAAATTPLLGNLIEEPILRFGIISDVHQDVMHDGEERLAQFIEAMNSQDVDFIMQLGDFCIPKAANKPFMDIWNQFKGDKFHVLGNHDTDGGYSQEQTQEFWEMPEQYYSFDRGGLHFVVLDGNDAHAGHAGGYKRHVGAEQREWLRADLRSTDLPCIVICHQSLEEESGGLDNTRAMQVLLEAVNYEAGWKKVFLSMSGHHHIDFQTRINGIDYLQVNSAAYQWLGGDWQRTRYPEEIEKQHTALKYTSPYVGPLWTVGEVYKSGVLKFQGMETQWLAPSMWDIGYPEKPSASVTKDSCVPLIRDRQFRFRP